MHACVLTRFCLGNIFTPAEDSENTEKGWILKNKSLAHARVPAALFSCPSGPTGFLLYLSRTFHGLLQTILGCLRYRTVCN